MDNKFSKILDHHLKCEHELKLDQDSSDVFLMQNILASVAWFESKIKKQYSKEIIIEYMANISKANLKRELTYITLLKKFLTFANQSENLTKLNITEFEWNTIQYTKVKNKKIKIDWSTFFVDYIIPLRNKCVHDFELDSKINNGETFKWFYNGVKSLCESTLIYLNKFSKLCSKNKDKENE